MKMGVELKGRRWAVDGPAYDISIPLRFGGPQPSAFGLPAARAWPFEAGSFVGDTRRGGSANCYSIEMTPHGNGTHTECVGHIIDSEVFVFDALGPGFIATSLISVEPVARESVSERYNTPPRPGDRVVSAAALEAALRGVDRDWCDGLVLRTLPVAQDKAAARHCGTNPPFFTIDAMELVREVGVNHLLVDLPSVDREEDDGLLEAHHIFWEVPSGQHTCASPRPGRDRTITEMVNVEEHIADGAYLLQIHIPRFCLDAAPSRPFLYPVSQMETDA
jgi:hypothetical protein